MYSFNIKNKLASLASDAFNHSAHTVLSTIGTGMAFGVVGAAVGLGLGLADELLIYSNITDTHYLTYAALTVSAASVVGSYIASSELIMNALETTIAQAGMSMYFDYHNKEAALVEPITDPYL